MFFIGNFVENIKIIFNHLTMNFLKDKVHILNHSFDNEFFKIYHIYYIGDGMLEIIDIKKDYVMFSLIFFVISIPF